MGNQTKIVRPEYDLYNPNIKGNALYHISLKIIVTILLIFYISYSVSLFRQLSNFSALELIINLLIIFAELILGYYSLLLLLHLANSFRSISHPLSPRITSEDINTTNLPFISVLLPIYHEPLNVVKQTIRAALDLNYPSNRYRVVVAEDSPENKSIEKYCQEIDVKYKSRTSRKGYKAGAVNNVLSELKGRYVLFIDADHILEPNILYNCLLAWRENTIAVQSRIDFVNTPSLLTSVSAYLQIQFYSLYQKARRATGSAIFAGGAALFDRELLIKEGGLNELTIADDTDTSFILRARNYRIEFIDTIGAWALIPWDPLHLIRQIWRWLTGITRSFRARAMMIIRGNSPLYVKFDHLSVAIFPTISLLIWISAFLKIYLLFNGNLISPPQPVFNLQFLGLLPLIVPLCSIFAGVMALYSDNKQILYHKKSQFQQLLGVTGFYILMFAGQPFLIGAIIKGLFGVHVSFNRTPKEKQVHDEGLVPIKRQYFAFSIFLAVLGTASIIVLIINGIFNIGIYILIGLALTMLIPLGISILWYWKLETYLEKVEGVTALDYLQ